MSKTLLIKPPELVREYRVLHDRVCGFLKCTYDSYKLPVFRQLLKIHKRDLNTRLLTSGTQWVTNPASSVLAVNLQPICSAVCTIARDTNCVLSAISAADLNGKTKVHTFDVEKLYPSMDQARVRGAVKRTLCTFFSIRALPYWGVLVELLLCLLDAVFEGQIGAFVFAEGLRGIFKQRRGITTGLSCGVQLANLFLIAMDLEIHAAFSRHIRCYRRFVDDILVITDACVSIHQLLHVFFNSFDEDIAVTNEDCEDGRHASFLDVFISIHVGFFTFQTFRKPLCSYCYTPANSCHNPSIFRAIVKTELIRLLRTNSEEGTFLYHVEFFVGKLLRCGYALPMVREIVDSVPWRDKHRILSRTQKTRI